MDEEFRNKQLKGYSQVGLWSLTSTWYPRALRALQGHQTLNRGADGAQATKRVGGGLPASPAS